MYTKIDCPDQESYLIVLRSLGEWWGGRVCRTAGTYMEHLPVAGKWWAWAEMAVTS